MLRRETTPDRCRVIDRVGEWAIGRWLQVLGGIKCRGVEVGGGINIHAS